MLRCDQANPFVLVPGGVELGELIKFIIGADK